MGTFEQLCKADGYLQTLLKDDKGDETSEVESADLPDDKDDESKAEYQAKATKTQDDQRRQLGDKTVYGYYFGSMGVPFLVLLLFLEIGWGFLESFGSKSYSLTCLGEGD